MFEQRPVLFVLIKILLITAIIGMAYDLHSAYFSNTTALVPPDAQPGFEAIRGENMRTIAGFLAADELEGRATASRGLNIAAKFLESHYTLAGLTPAPGAESMLQSFAIVESRFSTRSNARLIGTASGEQVHRFAMYDDFYLLNRSNRGDTITAPIIFAGYGISDPDAGYDDFAGIDARGKIVLVLRGGPVLPADSTGRNQRLRASTTDKLQAIERAGAVAVLHIGGQAFDATVGRLRAWLDRPGFSLAGQPRELPQLFISGRMAGALLAHAATDVQALKMKIDQSGSPHSFELAGVAMALQIAYEAEQQETQNVVAYLEGSDANLKHEVVILGAHYDHLGTSAGGDVFNGADDNASGTTAILEIARAFARNPVKPRRSLLFISHTGEENGLLGSEYYTTHPLIPLENTVAQLNIDMIGRNDDNSVYIIGSDFLSTELHHINEKSNKIIGLDFDYSYNSRTDPNRFYYRSDHYNYAKHGIPVIFYFTGTHEDYHQPSDTVDKLNFSKMERIARLVYLTAWQVANLEQRPAVDGATIDDEREQP